MRNKQTFVSVVSGGKVTDVIAKHVFNLFKNMYEGKKVKITIEEYKKQRSLNQNNFYWGVVLPCVVQMFAEAGDRINADECHEYLKRHIGKLTRLIKTPLGDCVSITSSSTELNTAEWEDFIEQIRVWASGFGVTVPFPNEHNINYLLAG